MSNPNDWGQQPPYGGQPGSPYGPPHAGGPHYGPPYEQPRSSGSGCWRIFLMLLVVGGVSLVCCCGVGAWLGSAFTPIQNVADVKKVQETIVQVDLPPGFEGKVAMDVWWVDGRLAIFQRDADKGVALLVGLPEWIFKDRPDIVEDIRNNRGGGNQQNGQLEMEEIEQPATRTKTVKIDGRDVAFTIETGKGEKSDRELKSVTGDFVIGDKKVLFMLHGEAAQLDDATIDATLESIKAPAK